MADVSAAAADPQRPLLEYYDERLRRHGDTAAGAGWPNDADRRTRFAVLTEALRRESGGPAPVVCDLGCGTGELLGWLRAVGRRDIGYIGADRSTLALGHAAAKFPEARWVEIDVMSASPQELDALRCDWLVAEGLFASTHGLSQEDAWGFVGAVLERLWPRVRRGIAFCVLSPLHEQRVAQGRFPVSYDRMAKLLQGLAGPRFQMRADFGMAEYACIAFKPDADPPRPQAAERITAFRPLLPDTVQLVPYLKRIDSTRIYSNHGPLAAELEQRLGARLGLAGEQFISAASGTAALVAGILAAAGRATPERPYALCPAYTFVGTASALQQCGYTPWLVDVQAETWQADAQALLRHPMLARTGVVVPVAAYGRVVPMAAWERFRQACGVPVVIDGAACIEGLLQDPAAHVGAIPVALSFHATKAFATGEGGAILTRDTEMSHAAFRVLNFGFRENRESRCPAINGKMSEYHAAVGLAELSSWEPKRSALLAVAQRYRSGFAAAGLTDRFHAGPDIASNYALFRFEDQAPCAAAQRALEDAAIESRLWYGLGLHRQPALEHAPRDTLAGTEALAPTLLGLPMAPDLHDDDVDRVVSLVSIHARQT